MKDETLMQLGTGFMIFGAGLLFANYKIQEGLENAKAEKVSLDSTKLAAINTHIKSATNDIKGIATVEIVLGIAVIGYYIFRKDPHVR